MKVIKEEIRSEIVFQKYIELISKNIESYFYSVSRVKIPMIDLGKIDLDLLENKHQYLNVNCRKSVINYQTSVEIQKLATCISANGLSSHMMITCRKQ